MQYTKDFSVIVPVWRGAIRFLPKLIDSIPDKEEIEIIVVDNSLDPVKREEIDSLRDFVFFHSEHCRHAGGSRNDGMLVAKGKWLLFADADDYFTPNAFDIFYSNFFSDAEIVYTGMKGVYSDTGTPSDRGDIYTQKVHKYCSGLADEIILRIGFASPCCKMVSHELVNRYELRYDEIRAGNDVYFSLATGILANAIDAVDSVTYIATVNRGSLTMRRDYEVIRARYCAVLHCNQFMKEHGYGKYQSSVMYYLVESRRFGIKKMFIFLSMLINYRQNPFIGYKNWVKTFWHNRKVNKINEDYIVR